MSATISTVAILGARYLRGAETVPLTHSYRDGDATTLCGRITADGLADVHAADPSAHPTCARCRARDPRRID